MAGRWYAMGSYVFFACLAGSLPPAYCPGGSAPSAAYAANCFHQDAVLAIVPFRLTMWCCKQAMLQENQVFRKLEHF